MEYNITSFVSLYPCQMDITFTEKCNQNCDYCWVNKSNFSILSIDSIKKGLEIFFGFPLKEQTVTFTVSEPFVIPILYKQSIDYILCKAQQLQKKINIVTTTNGINLTEDIRDFIIAKMEICDTFSLNISIDGKQRSHDAHRKLNNNSTSAFSVSWKNLLALPKEMARIILTITPSEADLLKENIIFLLKAGFKKIDIFPQMFTLWHDDTLKVLQESILSLTQYLNNNLCNSYDVRILNRLWGSSHYNKLLLSCDGNFYLFEWILAIPNTERKRYVIGNINKKIDLKKRLLLFNDLFKGIARATRNKCVSCNYGSLCAYPLPLFLWSRHYERDFNRYFENFCRIVKIFIDCSQKLDGKLRNILDCEKLNRIRLPACF